MTSSTLGELGAYFRALLGGCVPRVTLVATVTDASTVALEEGSLDSWHSTHFSAYESRSSGRLKIFVWPGSEAKAENHLGTWLPLSFPTYVS